MTEEFIELLEKFQNDIEIYFEREDIIVSDEEYVLANQLL